MMKKVTESESNFTNLELMDTKELLVSMNQEDKTVPIAVEAAIPQIRNVVNKAFEKLSQGGRLFYFGSGTSGRLGIVDASECPPTFGVSPNLVIGLIAGGDKAIRKAVEMAEDDLNQAWKDLQEHEVNENDFVIGISASGTTPYVIGGLKKCNEHNIPTACIVCNTGSPIGHEAKYPIEVVVGPEFVTGSTRMKSGTAQKLVLNMISTSLMIKLGHVEGNKMVDMQLSNAKLIERGTKMIVEQTGIGAQLARSTLLQFGSVRKAVMELNKKSI